MPSHHSWRSRCGAIAPQAIILRSHLMKGQCVILLRIPPVNITWTSFIILPLGDIFIVILNLLSGFDKTAKNVYDLFT